MKEGKSSNAGKTTKGYDNDNKKILIEIGMIGTYSEIKFHHDFIPKYVYLYVKGVNNVQIINCSKKFINNNFQINVKIESNPYDSATIYAFF